MKQGIRNRGLTVAFLMSAPVDPLNLIAFTSVLRSQRLEGGPAYQIVILTTGTERVAAGTDGIMLANSIPYFEHTGPIDILVIIGGDNKSRLVHPGLTQWLQKRITPTKRIVCVGAGIFLPAATGLLDGKRVTTHWRHIEGLAKAFPALRVERSPIFVRDGNIYSTAGVTAGIDLALALVEEDHGHSVAAAAARDLVVYMRRSGNEAQYSSILAQQANVGGTLMRDLPAWARARIAQKLDVSALAKVVAMTPRTFARQFEAHFQTTPARWLQALRVEAACVHIETGDIPLKVIAGLTGFRDEQALRRAFLQQFSLTPKQYRERYDATACDMDGEEISCLSEVHRDTNHALAHLGHDVRNGVA